MELLAPAGSKEAFVAAIRGGADSVYVGIKSFNARVHAKNLSFHDLEALLDYAHGRGRKVYVAFNTLLKHSEMDEAAAALETLEELGPDAIIVQDMGIARLARERFPGLELHASTQAAVHNSQGVAVMAAMGFKRVILARELSFSELKLIAARSKVGLEVFCHGALCFCVSGMCLFSSAIGGQSGNRGRCTQPCRRIWRTGRERGYLFSPRDLRLAEQVPKLRSAGVAALKIEGRMRSSDYVHRVVRAYRTLIDAKKADFPKALEEARALLDADYARAKSTALFSGRDPRLFGPSEAQCLGLRIGEVLEARQERLSVDVSRPLARGDRLRISDPAGDRTAAIKVKAFKRSGRRHDLPYAGPAFKPGSPVFLAGDAASQEKSFAKEVDDIFSGRPARRRSPARPGKEHAALLRNRWTRKRGPGPERLLVRVDDPGWLPLLSPDAGLEPVISLDLDNLQPFLRLLERPGPGPRGTLCELPPYIGQRELPDFRRAVRELRASGFERWVLNNPGHFGFFEERPAELVSGPFLYTLNAYAALAWGELGVSSFMTSWEDDVLNLRELSRLALGSHLIVFLYGRPPVARSRLLTRELCGTAPVEEKGLRFRRLFRAGSGIVIPDEPVSLFTARAKLRERGVAAFGIDLSFISPDKSSWDSIYSDYRSGSNPDDSIKLNFKRGLK